MSDQVSMEALGDEELMRRFLDGDRASFEVVYRRRRESLRRFLGRQCGSEAVGAELAQEVWMKLLRACENGQYTAEAKFTTYLFRLGRNHLIDWYRKNKDFTVVEFNEEVSGGEAAEYEPQTVHNPERLLADKEKLKIVLDGIERLSAEQKQTLLMYVEGEMSYDEIAEAMETKRETVKTRLRYARAHLKKLVFAEG